MNNVSPSVQNTAERDSDRHRRLHSTVVTCHRKKTIPSSNLKRFHHYNYLIHAGIGIAYYAAHSPYRIRYLVQITRGKLCDWGIPVSPRLLLHSLDANRITLLFFFFVPETSWMSTAYTVLLHQPCSHLISGPRESRRSSCTSVLPHNPQPPTTAGSSALKNPSLEQPERHYGLRGQIASPQTSFFSNDTAVVAIVWDEDAERYEGHIPGHDKLGARAKPHWWLMDGPVGPPRDAGWSIAGLGACESDHLLLLGANWWKQCCQPFGTDEAIGQPIFEPFYDFFDCICEDFTSFIIIKISIFIRNSKKRIQVQVSCKKITCSKVEKWREQEHFLLLRESCCYIEANHVLLSGCFIFQKTWKTGNDLMRLKLGFCSLYDDSSELLHFSHFGLEHEHEHEQWA